MKKLAVALLALLVLTACSSKGPENKGDRTTYKVGIHGGDSGLAWNEVQRQLKDEGITLEIVRFANYPEPNAALAAGEIDLNAFQHHAYFEKEKADFKYDLVAVADTYIAPMGSYSSKITSVDDLKDGAKILIPNDVTNGGRALNLLKTVGLIDLNNAEGEIPSLKNVVNPRGFDIVELGAANIPGSLNEADLAVINSGIAIDAKLDPKSTLFVEEVDLNNKEPYKQYINLIAARTEDKDNAVIKRIVEIYHTDELKEIVDKDSKGSNIPVW